LSRRDNIKFSIKRPKPKTGKIPLRESSLFFVYLSVMKRKPRLYFTT
jgi:hypothetical protein